MPGLPQYHLLVPCLHGNVFRKMKLIEKMSRFDAKKCAESSVKEKHLQEEK